MIYCGKGGILVPKTKRRSDRLTVRIAVLGAGLLLLLSAVLLIQGFRQEGSLEPSGETTEATMLMQETLPPNPYAPGDYQYLGNYLTCTAGETVMGVDVSSHQEVVDWQQVANAGASFAMVRLGYRGYSSGTLHEDIYARDNISGAGAVGLKVGAYLFSQAVSVQEALAEAEFALEILEGMPLDMPLVYDWEYVNETARTAHVDAQTLTECTIAFCERIRQAGYRPMVYFNSHQAENLLELEALTDYPWWLALYDDNPVFPYRVDMWQYTQSGTVPGIPGAADVNLLYLDYGLGKELFSEKS